MEMAFKGLSIFSSGRHSVQPSGTILAILIEGHWRNILCKYFEIGPLIKDNNKGSILTCTSALSDPYSIAPAV